MRPRTIWQRLKTALALLLLLLLAAIGLSLWVGITYSSVQTRRAELLRRCDRMKFDVIVIADALRGQWLDPSSQPEAKPRLGEAEEDLQTILASVEKEFAAFPDLVSAVKHLGDYALGSGPGSLGEFHNRVRMAAETDSARALAYYNTNYPAVGRQRDQLFRSLATQAGLVNTAEAGRAFTVVIVGALCLVLTTLASLFVCRLQSSAVAEPLGRLTATLERMRQGDFSERVGLQQPDEFGVVGQGLNRLADDLCELVGQVQRSGIQVNTSATQIAATAREQETTAHEIAATSAQIGSTSKEISATSRELVKTMNEVSHVAEQTASLAGSGQTAIAHMEATMRQIMAASGSISAKLSTLSEKTANINSVVTTITKVADQTNLLSLNAAIEAEKAGEYGLGFAVVAMEIRRLADQTAVATYDIEKMVKEMQSAVAAGVMGMDKFSEEVRTGVEEIRQVSTHLAQIIHQVQTLTPRFQMVNEGMHAQATGAQQISETLVQLSEAARQTADSLRQSNQAIEQLNGAARGLQTSVARFKLNPPQPGAPAGNGHD